MRWWSKGSSFDSLSKDTVRISRPQPSLANYKALVNTDLPVKLPLAAIKLGYRLADYTCRYVACGKTSNKEAQ